MLLSDSTLFARWAGHVMNEANQPPADPVSVGRRFSQLCSDLCVSPGDKDEQRLRLITFILDHPEARAQFVPLITAILKAKGMLEEVGLHCIKVLQWHEFTPARELLKWPEPARAPA